MCNKHIYVCIYVLNEAEGPLQNSGESRFFYVLRIRLAVTL